MSKLTIWYDGACPLCRREIAFMRRLDRRGRIHFHDIAADEDPSCPVDRADLLDRFHARENGRLYHGAQAFAAMWRAIPWLWPFGQLARLPIISHLLELAYRGFLRLRPRLVGWLGGREA
ncbi:thiol-disulfide oxidoreductase DCC family protein [Sphingomicrobium sediminis]|uniref:DUF393 domain-containing protein n=1 Tax=Sphingomicrobium sediminis TaxID=2950949 RepID=A0A9X2EH19_9SPHN|nr:DUF393 domain-containing protein [Sphingomicrobium sediminis]MCM8557865.1 DUF393 domain-containing protein [Sphingomicrobium sediminis]